MEKLESEFLAIPEDKKDEKIDIVKQIMLGIATRDLPEEKEGPMPADIPKDRISAISRALILRFIDKQQKHFKIEYEKAIADQPKEGSDMMTLFRFKFVTFLTATTFNQISKGLQNC